LEHLPRKPVFQVFRTANEAAFGERAAVLLWDRPARDKPPPFALPDRLDHLAERELYALARGARYDCELERVWKEIDRRRALAQKTEP
jgi:hypothetical protein